MTVRRHFLDDGSRWASHRGLLLCRREQTDQTAITDDPERVTCVRCRSEFASRDPRTRLCEGDVVTVDDDPTERVIGRYLTRGVSGKDYSCTSWTLIPLVKGHWDWVDYQHVTIVRQLTYEERMSLFEERKAS